MELETPAVPTFSSLPVQQIGDKDTHFMGEKYIIIPIYSSWLTAPEPLEFPE